MDNSDIKDNNNRILKLVIVLIWLIVFLIIILGIVFPLVYISSLKQVYLKDQSVTVKLSSEFIHEYLYQRGKTLAASADMDFMKDANLLKNVNPEFRGIPANGAAVQRQYLQKLLDWNPSFRFFAYMSKNEAQPIFMQPYQFQINITRAQFDRGYAYREWVQKTIEKYRSWDKQGYLEPYIADAFLSQPGNIPAVSISTAVLDERKEMIGILYVNMGLDSLSQYVKSLAYGKTGKIYLVDSHGFLLAHPDMSPAVEAHDENGNFIWALRDFSYNPMVARALKKDFTPGIYRIPETNGFVLATYQVIPDVGWILIIEQNVSEAFSIVKMYVYVIAFLLIITVAISFLTFLYVSKEIAESTKQHHELLIISETDPLTGLLNRRSMLSRMSQIVKNAEQTGQGFVLAMFDIDDFKKVNDTHGHIFGDVVLREIAARAVSILRIEDLLFRWGGEEFLVIIRNSDLVRGRAVAEKIRKVVCDTPINDGVTSQTVTITIGVSRYKKGSIESLILKTDKALYSGKRRGKNVVAISED